MRIHSFLSILFAVGCLLIFSGQQRYYQQRPVRATSNRAPVKSADTPSKSAEPVDSLPTLEPPQNTEPEIGLAKTTGKIANAVAPNIEFTPLIVLTPNDFVWPERAQGERNSAPQSITLLGDTRTEGLYVIRTRIPKGKQIVPHVHGDSRSVVVISGTYYYGIGPNFDAKQLRSFPPGSFLTEPAGLPHYSWAKDDEVVIQTTAIGPSTTRVLPDALVTENRNE